MATLSQYFDKKVDGLELIAFDLDYTLWPFFVDCSDPPFKKTDKHVVDRHGGVVKPYANSTEILQRLSVLGYKIGIASRTGSIKDANSLVKLFNWEQYIDHKEIYPGCKVQHFKKFKKDSGIPFEQMLFFDDEERNITDINQLGAVAIYVDSGVSNKVVAEGIEYFVRKRDAGK